MNASMTCTLFLSIMFAFWSSTTGRKVHLGSCMLTLHSHELRHHFHQIRHNMLTQDNHKGLRLLRGDMLKTLQAAESCCFLSQLLNFYIENVFNSYTSSHSLHRKTTSVLANSFHSMIKDLRACHAEMHCQCNEETTQKFDHFQSVYYKLDAGAATVKAIGELDSLLHWLESFQGKPEHRPFHVDYFDDAY